MKKGNQIGMNQLIAPFYFRCYEQLGFIYFSLVFKP